MEENELNQKLYAIIAAGEKVVSNSRVESGQG
jgi:hypothetical protein